MPAEVLQPYKTSPADSLDSWDNKWDCQSLQEHKVAAASLKFLSPCLFEEVCQNYDGGKGAGRTKC